MRFVRYFTQFIVNLALALIALNILLRNWPIFETTYDPIWSQLPEWLYFTPADWQYHLVWGLMLLLPMLIWSRILSPRRRPVTHLNVKTKGGEVVRFVPDALNKFVDHQVISHPAVKRHNVRVVQSGGKSITAKGRVKIKVISAVPSIKKEIEDSITDGFSQVLGILNVKPELEIDFARNAFEQPAALSSDDYESKLPVLREDSEREFDEETLFGEEQTVEEETPSSSFYTEDDKKN